MHSRSADLIDKPLKGCAARSIERRICKSPVNLVMQPCIFMTTVYVYAEHTRSLINHHAAEAGEGRTCERLERHRSSRPRQGRRARTDIFVTIHPAQGAIDVFFFAFKCLLTLINALGNFLGGGFHILA